MKLVKNNFEIMSVRDGHVVQVDYESFNFSAGEIHIKVEDCQLDDNSIIIEARLNSSNDIMELLMLNDSLKRMFSNDIILKLLYTPFSRQDRINNKGEAFTLKVFANLINSCHFLKVVMLDNHSDVSTALINNAIEISQLELFKKSYSSKKYNYVISPDAGANKKAFKIAQYLGIPMIQADKVRDTTTGEIKRTIVHTSGKIMNGASVIIVDDICDGGRTVIEIAKVLKNECVREIDCYFTHGIFSKGLDVLFDADINHIYTTDSFHQEQCEKLSVVKS